MDILISTLPPSFHGMAIRLPDRKIRDSIDAITQWNLLKHPKFTNVFQEGEHATKEVILKNKQIREDNYKFLDMLEGNCNKYKFIQYFKKVTGFPNVKECSNRMSTELTRTLINAAKANNSELLLSGYDRFCSTGLQSSFPGSDIDKAYGIVKSDYNNDYWAQKNLSNKIKESIWNNIDNRIMSVNHYAAFPNIMTDKELNMTMDKFDRTARTFVNTDNIGYFQSLRAENGNPISGSKFNIWLSERLNSREDKEEAKNFAYIIETIRDGINNFINENYIAKLFSKMNSSFFSWCSNINQNYIMEKKYSNIDITKAKLRARRNLENSFDTWSISQQYDLVKDVIRSMSGDNNNPEFKDFFESKTDRHRLLLNDILRGNVNCSFQYTDDGAEITHLFFKDHNMIKKYYDLGIYNTDY